MRPRSLTQERVSFGRASVQEVRGGGRRALAGKAWPVAGIVAGDQMHGGPG
jgi:hypothetical protein